MNAIVVKVHNGYFYKGQKEFIINDGKTLIIDATTAASYELMLQSNQQAPEQILIEKRGDDLLIAFEDKTHIDMVVRDFFLFPDSQLVGMDSMREYYSYLPVQNEYEKFFGKDLWLGTEQESGAQLVELGSYGKITPWLLEAKSEPMADMLKPTLFGLGASAVLLLGIESFRKENTKTPKVEPDLVEKPKQPTEAKMSDDGTVVTGKAEPNSTIILENAQGKLGSTITDNSGNFSITIDNPQINGERLKITAKNKGAQSAALFFDSVDSTNPEPVSNVSINEQGTEVTGEAEPNSTVKVLDLNDNVIGVAKTDKSGNYIVTLLQAQNHEEQLTIQVFDKSGNSSKSTDFTGSKGDNTIISNIIDVNKLANSVDENADVGSNVGLIVKASDFEEITYSLVNNAGGRFSIDTNTGVVTTAKKLDFESKDKHTITVRANSSDGTNTEKSFVIKVNNINDNDISALTDTNQDANQVSVYAKLGSTVGVTVKATDADKSDITYSMLDNPDGLFSVGVTTGVLTTAKPITQVTEPGKGHVVKIQASSTDGTTSELEVTIDLKALSSSSRIISDNTHEKSMILASDSLIINETVLKETAEETSVYDNIIIHDDSMNLAALLTNNDGHINTDITAPSNKNNLETVETNIEHVLLHESYIHNLDSLDYIQPLPDSVF